MTRLEIRASSGRTVELDGRELVYVGGCGYLGLAHEPLVLAALQHGAARFGASAGASRETSGNCSAYDELERAIAERLGFEAALLTPEGYVANCVAAQMLAARRNLALIDERSHPSLVDASRAAGMRVERWPHGDLAHLESRARAEGEQAVLVSDGVFPSAGELAPLRAMAEIAARTGAALWVDDCHGTGVVGPTGRGALEHAKLAPEAWMLTSTLSKALGCYGGFVATSATNVSAARRDSSAYIGTTPPPPPLACAALTALELALDDSERLRRLRANCAQLRRGMEQLGLPTPREDLPVFALRPSEEAASAALSRNFESAGLLVPLVSYLDPHSRGYFRIVVNALHRDEDLECLLDALRRVVDDVQA